MSHARLDRSFAALAVCALSIWIGGTVALGACAAPLVFRIVPAPLAGDAMGSVFRRFDAFAISAAVVVLGCEAVRSWIAARPTSLSRTRTSATLVAAASAIYRGVAVSPAIVGLHAAGAIRGVAADGAALERWHRLAEALAKTEVFLGLGLIVMHVLTAGAADDEGDSE